MDTYATPAIDLRALIESRAPTRLEPKSRANGGQWAGACPFCGGKNRFLVWPHREFPGYWCRVCGRTGGPVRFLMDYEGKSKAEALRELDLQDENECHLLPSTHMTRSHAPSKIWQETGRALCHTAQYCLWETPRGAPALAYLRKRGLDDSTIREAMLGYSPGVKMAGETWGMQTKQLVIPRGIVIPWYSGGDLWKITLRLRNGGDHRYEQVLGSQECLYNADTIAGKVTVLYEGVFDALSGQQVAPEFAHVATDDVQKCHQARWIVKLCQGSRVLVAYDAEPSGDGGAVFWTRTLSHAVRLRPWAKDVNAMLTEGQDILEWLVMGLA